jgi:hypothetical protein
MSKEKNCKTCEYYKGCRNCFYYEIHGPTPCSDFFLLKDGCCQHPLKCEYKEWYEPKNRKKR